MKKSVKLFTGAACMVSYAFLVQWLMCFSALTGDTAALHTPFWALAAAFSATFVIDSLLLEKGVPLPVYFGVQLAETALTVFLFAKLLVLQSDGAGTFVFGAGMTAILSLSAAYSAYFPAGKNSIVLRFDVCCIAITILLLLTKMKSLPDLQEVVLCGGFTMLLLLCGIISISAGSFTGNVYQGSPGKGRFVVAAIGIVVVLLAAAVYAFGSGALSDVSHGLAGAIKAVGQFLFGILKFIWEQIVRFMLWLASLMPDTGAASAGGVPVAGIQQEAVDYGEFALPKWMIALPIAAVVAFVAFILIYFRRQRLHVGKAQILYAETKTVRSSGLRDAFRSALKRLKEKIIYRVDAVRYRNTAPGVYDFLCRNVRKEKRKCPGESPSCFVRRIAPAAAEQEFESLSAALEKCFYLEERIPLDRVLCRKIRRLSRKI